MKNSIKRNKEKNSFDIPKHIILIGKLIQIISPDLAARFVAKIFETPLKFKAPERELMMRKSAKNNLLNLRGIRKKVMVYSYGYSKKKILLVHGWSGRGTQLYSIADKILENKMMVISFDGPAHGMSHGSRTSLKEFIKCIQQLEKEYGPFDAAVGHSFGAMALLNAVTKGLKLNNLIIIGADNSITEIIKSSVEKFSLKPIIAQKLIELINKRSGINVEDYSSQNVAKNVDIPTLVIHDSEDKYVPVRNALAIRHSLNKGELLMTDGLGHHKILKDASTNQRIIDFLV